MGLAFSHEKGAAMHRKSRMITIAVAVLASLPTTQPASANTNLSGNATADNAFFAFVSMNPATLGTAVGSGNAWGSPFSVSSANLGPGTYYLQIEAINYGGPGGFSAVLNLNGNGMFSNGTQSLTTDPSNLSYWFGGYNNANSSVTVQPWVMPAGGVLQETSYGWGNVVGTSNWIWPSDPLSSPGGAGGPCANCTVDLMAQFTVPGINGGVPEPATWTMMLLGFAAIGFAMRQREASITHAA